MKLKNIKFNIIYYVFILFLIIISGFILNKLSTNSKKTFEAFALYRTFFTVLLLFGFSLGLEYLFNEKKKNGKWKVDFLKLLILGIPSLFIIIWIWFPLVFKIIIIKTISPYIFNHDMISNLSVILFGWVLATSIYKHDSDKS